VPGRLVGDLVVDPKESPVPQIAGLTGSTVPKAKSGTDLVAAVRWSAASLTWAILTGGASVAAGVAASSAALIGFGLDSLLDGGASAVLVWRFREELRGHPHSHLLEQRAARAVGALLAAIALYLVAHSVHSLAHHTGPSASTVGLIITGASLFVLPVLARAKLRLSKRLGSRALRADAFLSGAAAALAVAALLGLALSTGLDLWWADSVAALMIAVMLARESMLTLRAASTLTT
jgi:divalent metal cation (Fe/Co/Zn/Cd) transporter